VQLTVASFNLNNLFSSFNWSGTIDPALEDITYLQRNPDGSTVELDDVAFLVRRSSDDRRRIFMGRLITEKKLAERQRITARLLTLGPTCCSSRRSRTRLRSRTSTPSTSGAATTTSWCSRETMTASSMSA